ncbi:unnamed protein product [Urochloa humidicola]
MQKAALGLPAGDGLPASLNVGTAKVAAIGRELTTTRGEKAASSSMRSFTLVAPVRAANNKHVEEEEYDGGGSESSSDLFEIKSLMIEECCAYEPSEASIQWSVVTAGAADAPLEQRGDRASVGRGPVVAGGRGPVVAGGRQYRDHRPAGLLAGCASHKAVDVSAATTTKAVAAMQRRSDGFHKARSGGA